MFSKTISTICFYHDVSGTQSQLLTRALSFLENKINNFFDLKDNQENVSLFENGD